MQKLKLGSLILLLLLFIGCKSVPTGSPVNPVDLLDNKSAFYISIPANSDEELIEKVIEKNISDISEKDINKIIQKLDKIYCGLNHSFLQTEYQVVASTKVNVSKFTLILTEKNGWSERSFVAENTSNVYKIYSKNGIDLAFPSNKLVCGGRDITKMLSAYDQIVNTPAEPEDFLGINYAGMDQELYDWISNVDEAIHFFANKPQSFLSILTGQKLNLNLIDVKGSFKLDPEYPNQYLLDLDFFFKNEKFRKAGKTLLSMAFGLTDSQVFAIGTNELQVNGIKINKVQLFKILVL